MKEVFSLFSQVNEKKHKFAQPSHSIVGPQKKKKKRGCHYPYS
jgi:hypothetical protein